MPRSFSQMSMPLPNSPQPGYGGPPPGYGAPSPKKSSAVKIVLIVMACVFGGGILIIGILAAILFPVFQKVRENARLSSCLANVRQIELGLTMYTQEHDGNFPPSSAKYKEALSSLGASEQIFHCPSDQGGEVDYSLNTHLQGINLASLPHPERIVAVYEGKNQMLDFRHNGKAVVGFADGHDKAYTKADAESLKWIP